MQNITKKTKRTGLSGVLIECLIFIAIFLVAQSIQGIFMAIPVVVLLFRGDILDQILSGNTDPFALANKIVSDPLMLVTTLFSTAVVIFVVIMYCKMILKRPVSYLGIKKGKGIIDYTKGILLGLAFSSTVYGLLMLTGCVESVSSGKPTIMVAVLFVGFIIQSASEELLMRGYFMNALTERSNVFVAIIVNSVVFMALHLSNPGVVALGMVNIVIYGIVFSLLYLLSGNIWMVCGMHFSWNFALGCIYGGEVSGLNATSILKVRLIDGNELLTGGAFGVEGSIVTTLVGSAIAAVLFVLCWRKQRKHSQGII